MQRVQAVRPRRLLVALRRRRSPDGPPVLQQTQTLLQAAGVHHVVHNRLGPHHVPLHPRRRRPVLRLLPRPLQVRKQVPHLAAVDLHHRHAHRHLLHAAAAHLRLPQREEPFERAGDDAASLRGGAACAEHGVRLARARLAVRHDAHVVPVEHRLHQVACAALERLLLRRVAAQHAVEAELTLLPVLQRHLQRARSRPLREVRRVRPLLVRQRRPQAALHTDVALRLHELVVQPHPPRLLRKVPVRKPLDHLLRARRRREAGLELLVPALQRVEGGRPLHQHRLLLRSLVAVHLAELHLPLPRGQPRLLHLLARGGGLAPQLGGGGVVLRAPPPQVCELRRRAARLCLQRVQLAPRLARLLLAPLLLVRRRRRPARRSGRVGARSRSVLLGGAGLLLCGLGVGDGLVCPACRLGVARVCVSKAGRRPRALLFKLRHPRLQQRALLLRGRPQRLHFRAALLIGLFHLACRRLQTVFVFIDRTLHHHLLLVVVRLQAVQRRQRLVVHLRDAPQLAVQQRVLLPHLTQLSARLRLHKQTVLQLVAAPLRTHQRILHTCLLLADPLEVRAEVLPPLRPRCTLLVQALLVPPFEPPRSAGRRLRRQAAVPQLRQIVGRGARRLGCRRRSRRRHGGLPHGNSGGGWRCRRRVRRRRKC
eukprot:Rhum_TRINITY_DN15076_c3_g1::Rhum_TRINITY_DN15076_c3_g1_i1::g.136734::m.136734